MKKFIILLSFVIFSGCERDEALPKCVQITIDNLLAQPPRSPRSEIWQYQYKGKIVFYLTSACCDIPSVLWDDNCNTLCSPDGGISGHGDGGCPDFFTLAKPGQRIWKDVR